MRAPTFLGFLILSCSCAWAATELPEARVGRLAASWRPATGLLLKVGGVPVVRQSSLFLVKRGWKGTLFGQSSATWATEGWKEASDGSQSATLTARNEHAEATYTLNLSEAALDVALKITQRSQEPADWEYAAGYVSGNLLQDLPPKPGRTQEQNRLVSREFLTPLGKLTLRSSGDAGPDTLFDARSDSQGWAQAFPTLWWGIGSPAPEFPQSRVRTTTFTLAVSGEERTTPAAAVLPAEAIYPHAAAFLPPVARVPRVIPTPKEARFSAESFPLRGGQVIYYDDSHKEAARLLAEGILARTGLKFGVKNQPGAGLMIGKGVAPNPPSKPEGYAVAVTKSGVRAAGTDPQGALWAAQTLLQLVENGKIRGAQIADWPTLALRGVHLFHGQSAPAFHKKLIERVFSPFKLNTLILQVEQVRWDADPLVAPSWAGTRAGLSDEISFARERGLTTFPLIQGYGHMEWLFQKPANRELAEDPQTPYAVNFSNPEAVRYLEGFLGEADTLFGASAFHIGLDEVTMRGRFPYRSEGKNFVDLFTDGAAHWSDFFKKRGKKTWMWADMALHPSEVAPCFGTAPSKDAARAVREKLPRDIVLFDWQYGPHNNYPSLKLLKDAGFKNIVAATWYNPRNIDGFARAAAEVGALGAIQTTWCGYESKEAVLDTIERRQFSSMVLAAEAFWNGGSRATWKPEEVFSEAWTGPSVAPSRPRAGFTLGKKTGRLADGVLYDTSAPRTLCGPLETRPHPSAVTIRLGKSISEIYLLLSTTHRTDPGVRVGTVKIILASGELREVPLVYGKNIAASGDPATCPDAPTLEKMRRFTIALGPAPVEVRELRLEALGTEAAPVLHAVSGLAP